MEEKFVILSVSLVASAPAIEDQLLACFPLLSARQRAATSKHANTILIEAWEFVLPSSGLLQDLFTPPSADGVVTPSPTIVATEWVATDQGGKRGRKAHHTIYPSVAKCTLEFLQQHGWSAQERRRSSIANSVGVSLESLRNHLLATVPGLKEKGISRTTIHQLLPPPRQKSHNAAPYHSIVQARVPGKRNEEASHEHQHVHHCAAQVNLCMEFAAEQYDEIMSFSCDDMNKINIGAMAVSPCHQICRFFVARGEPNYPDHDFPLKNNKIIPSVYLFTRKASRGRPRLPHDSRLRSFSMPATEVRQCTNQVPPMRSPSVFLVGKAQEIIGRAKWRLTRNKLGRLHFAWPHTGPLHIYLR